MATTKRRNYKAKSKTKKTDWTTEEKEAWLKKKQEEQLKNYNVVEDSLLAFFEENAERAKRESYIYSNELQIPPVKLIFNEKNNTFSLQEFRVQELSQIEFDPILGEKLTLNIPVLATFKNMAGFLNHLKDDFVLDNAPKAFDPDKPMKGNQAKAEVMSSFFSCYDTENGKQLTGSAAYKRIEELKEQGKNPLEIGQILTNMKNNFKGYKYHSLDELKDVLPQHIKDQIPQIAMQEKIAERKMDIERMNLDAWVDAEIIKQAITTEYPQIKFVEEELNVAHCITAEDRSHSVVKMAAPEKYTSHAHYFAVQCHEFCHSTQAIDKRKVGKRVDGVNAFEEAIVELATSKMSKTLGYDYLMEEHAAYIISNIGKDKGELIKVAKHADRVYGYIKNAYDKHNTPKLRQELELKFKDKIKEQYGIEAAQKLESTKGNKRSGQRLRA
ncbi:zincin-like metallopeptidase domain-containing protein [Vibrio sp. EA2]|uniref:zincin-like metallopeptidase domain-containing protein n=1 Tax=Vibrio sp. EA2 TaxID=3079860 RepID=UPI00294A84C8|nr:zincin-like metallopeptidase domain-containing protein [Vibrio sp. EA2]MDV6250259.1 zincin-like metallopeptidase domain-containing protein [Vibrio sp. EA2]